MRRPLWTTPSRLTLKPGETIDVAFTMTITTPDGEGPYDADPYQPARDGANGCRRRCSWRDATGRDTTSRRSPSHRAASDGWPRRLPSDGPEPLSWELYAAPPGRRSGRGSGGSRREHGTGERLAGVAHRHRRRRRARSPPLRPLVVASPADRDRSHRRPRGPDWAWRGPRPRPRHAPISLARVGSR